MSKSLPVGVGCPAAVFFTAVAGAQVRQQYFAKQENPQATTASTLRKIRVIGGAGAPIFRLTRKSGQGIPRPNTSAFDWSENQRQISPRNNLIAAELSRIDILIGIYF